MSEYQETGNVTVSAMKADLSRSTARKYLREGKPPAEAQAKHTWRTRPDRLAQIWPTAEAMLAEAPDLEAKALFEYLSERWPGVVAENHLRTFQRRVKLWRLEHGPDKEVFFPQDWPPGRAMQLDWTHATELGVQIQGRLYDHLFCHVVLPYSNWEWATLCQSESLLSLRHGLQEGLHRLGKVPLELRVDNSSAATHRVGSGGQREFNSEFVAVCEHYGLTPRTIGIDRPNENGDVESINGHLKRRLGQHLLLRGSREFGSEGAYEQFLHHVLQRANHVREEKVQAELAVMKALPPTRLSEYDEVYCMVSSASTIRVKKVGYSVPARLIGEELKVEVYEQELRLYSGRQLLGTLVRHRGDRGVVLDYRHIINHLLRKPGAFEGYRYREQLFPQRLYRQAYDRMVERHGQRRGNLEYLRLLKLASDVGEPALELYLVEYVCPPYPAWSVDQLRQWVQPTPKCQVELAALEPELGSYDRLLTPSQEVNDAS
ncbi:MAG: IS21 family transposase [Verrucomicrobiia bacterium]